MRPTSNGRCPQQINQAHFRQTPKHRLVTIDDFLGGRIYKRPSAPPLTRPVGRSLPTKSSSSMENKMVQILSTLAIALAAATSANAQVAGYTSYPASVDASSYISEVWAPSPFPTQLPASVITTLASDLYSVEKSFISN